MLRLMFTSSVRGFTTWLCHMFKGSSDRPAAVFWRLVDATRAAIFKRSILLDPTDKKSKELIQVVKEYKWRKDFRSCGYGYEIEYDTIIKVMDLLCAGARAPGALEIIIDGNSPLPLLTVSKKTDLVNDSHWIEWAGKHVKTHEESKEFFRYCVQARELEHVPAFGHSLMVFIELC